MSRFRHVIPAFSLLLAFAAAEVAACSVCQGNPDSQLVKGAQGGVLVMILTTYGVLLCMGVLAATWFVRHRRLSRRDSGPSSNDHNG